MATFNASDIIFATLTQGGRTIASVRLSGMRTFSDIVRYLRTVYRDAMGLLTLSLRNPSQGWHTERNIMFGAPAARPVQLSLF